MIGKMIAKIRKEKGITKTKLSELTGINIGHLTHIEKGERNPSHKALYSICEALEIPYEEIMHTYDKELSYDQQKYNYLDYISYNMVPAFSRIEGFLECPPQYKSAAFAYKVPDDSMAPIFTKDSFVFVEIGGLLENKDFGLFKAGSRILIRRLLYRKNGLVLRAENKDMEIEDIEVEKLGFFKIIGKIYIE